MVPVTLSLAGKDVSLMNDLVAAEDAQCTAIKRDRILGGAELATVLVTLTPVVLTAVVKILKAKWKRDSQVEIEAGGVKLKGVSPDHAERILKDILDRAEQDDA